jgi:hypothetical protein
LAIRRFLSSFARPQWQDSVVDLAVILEGLFGGDSEQEITHRVALRTAMLIGTNPEESRRIFHTVRTFYGLRSGVVHASAGLEGRVRRVLKEWYGTAPSSGDTTAAVRVGTDLTARSLRAALLLAQHGGYRPFHKDFAAKLDLLSFAPAERAELQSHAGIQAAHQD